MAKKKVKKVVEPGSRIENVVAQFGKLTKNEGLITVLGAGDPIIGIPSNSSGIFSLDRILGIGGYAQGRIIEIYGNEASGKTTLTLQAVAQAQKAGGIAAFCDMEHAIDLGYAANLGVDLNSLIFTQPEYAEQALDIVGNLAKLLSGGDIIVLDSVAALTPKAELDGEMMDQQMGLQARIMGKALRKIVGTVSSTGVTVIFVNQIRQKLNITFGDPTETPGGKALKFAASQRLDIRKIGLLKEGTDVYGSKVRIKIVKNKVAPPFRECELELIFGEGIPKYLDLFNNAVNEGFIEHTGGGNYLLDGEKYCRGKQATIDLFKEDKELMDNIEMRLNEIYLKK